MTASPHGSAALALGLFVIGAVGVLATRGPAAGRSPLRWLALGMFPLAALAAWNAVFRAWPATFKFNPLTFPLYANFWGADLAPDGWLTFGLRLGATLVLVAGTLLLLTRTLRARRQRGLWLISLWVAIATTQLAVALVPGGWANVIRPWTAQKVYAHAARRVDRSGGVAEFLDQYVEVSRIQPVHARSHPAGATLLAYWAFDCVDPPRQRNVLILVALASLNMPLAFALGRQAFGYREAVAVSALMGAMPSAAAYSWYSQDPVYSVFFLLYLLAAWRTAVGPRPLLAALGGGAVLFPLTLLTYSWSIVAAIAFVFVAILAWRTGALRDRVRTLALLGTPPIVALVANVILWGTTGYDYVGAYLGSYEFHNSFYPFANRYEWWVALVGGQLELAWGVGPVTTVAFLAALGGWARRRSCDPKLAAFVLTGLVMLAIPVLVGPNPLKLETARCWYWMGIFIVIAAVDRLRELPGEEPSEGRYVMAAGASMATAIGSTIFLNFGA